eukprot:754681-Hanusia_phi.AAC.3
MQSSHLNQLPTAATRASSPCRQSPLQAYPERCASSNDEEEEEEEREEAARKRRRRKSATRSRALVVSFSPMQKSELKEENQPKTRCLQPFSHPRKSPSSLALTADSFSSETEQEGEANRGAEPRHLAQQRDAHGELSIRCLEGSRKVLPERSGVAAPGAKGNVVIAG